MLHVGSIIGGRIRIDRLLGAGGMGLVAAATHLELEQPVAVKVLRDELAENPTIVKRFLREARASAKLHTEHVCRVFDVGRLDSGAPYIVMELLEGNDLLSAIARQPLPAMIAVEYVIQACVAVAEAHAAGIIHRDLKPANLFVTRRPDGSALVKVLDFGIAKAVDADDARLTHTASAMGSPGYMSPEQLRSARDVDPRTDIWALGVTLYQLLSARMPFPGHQLADIAVKVQTATPAPLEVDPRLAAIVGRCLEKDREQRYPDVAALVADLVPFGGPSARRFASLVGSSVRPAPPAPAPVVDRGAPTVGTSAGARTDAPGAAHPGAPPSPPAEVARPLGRGLLVAVAVGVLVVGGIGVGWVVRGHPSSTAASPRDAGAKVAAAPGDAGATGPVRQPADAAPAAAGTDAGPAAGRDAGTSDPWAPHDALDPPPDAATDAEEEPASAPLPVPDMRRQFEMSRRSLESMLGLYGRDPKMRHDIVRGIVEISCQLGDEAKARQYAPELDPHELPDLRKRCARLHVSLGK